MSKTITKITQSNFSDAVRYAYSYKKKRISAHRTRKVILPLGSILFVLHALLITLGGLHALMADDELFAIQLPAFISTYWDGVLKAFSLISDLWYVQVLLMLVYLFLVPFAVCSVLALAIALLTRVPQLTVSGAHHEQAKQLHRYAENLPTSIRDDEDAHKLWRRITGVTYLLGCIAFLVYLIVSLMDTSEAATDHTALYMLMDSTIGIVIAYAVIYFVYILLHRLFTLIIRPYYIAADQSNNLASAARSYWVSVDPEEQRKAKERAKKAKERKPKATTSYSGYSGSYSGSYSSPVPMSRADMQKYIDDNCHGVYSYGGIETIENDSSLSASQKEDLKRHLMIWGD